MPSAEQRDRLKEALVVPARARRSALDRLWRGPTQPIAAGLVEALRRLNDARALGVSDLDLTGIHAGRLRIIPHAGDGGPAVLAAWEFPRRIERMATPPMHEAPLRIERRAYTFCVLQTVLAAFKRHDLYVMPSQRWG